MRAKVHVVTGLTQEQSGHGAAHGDREGRVDRGVWSPFTYAIEADSTAGRAPPLHWHQVHQLPALGTPRWSMPGCSSTAQRWRAWLETLPPSNLRRFWIESSSRLTGVSARRYECDRQEHRRGQVVKHWLQTITSRLVRRRPCGALPAADTRFADLDTVPTINEDDVLRFVKERLVNAGILSSAVTIRVHRVRLVHTHRLSKPCLHCAA